MRPFPTIPSLPRCWQAVLLATVCLAPTFAAGALRWEAQQIQFTAKPGDKEAVALFQFENTGSAPITITRVQPTCGCTTADLSKQTYAPGEKGEIKAVFAFGDRVGLQEKLIQVSTDDSSAPAVSLVLRVTIPELITCTPRFLLWTKGTEPTEQSAVVTVADPWRIASIEVGDPGQDKFAFRIEPVEPGKKYRLSARPLALAGITGNPLHCVARLEDGTTHPFLVYILVK